MNLVKRDCGIEMRLEVDGGWTDIHFDIGNEHPDFRLSYKGRYQLSDFLRILCCFNPTFNDDDIFFDNDDYDGGIEFLYSYYDKDTGELVKFAGPDDDDWPRDCRWEVHPWKAKFYLDEEHGAESDWEFERYADNSPDFMMKIHIERFYYHWEKGKQSTFYNYEVKYSDFCYAVAKAFTEMIKNCGLFGYYKASFIDDINLRYLLFIKSVAFNNYEAREFFDNPNARDWSSDFSKEIELLLADM